MWGDRWFKRTQTWVIRGVIDAMDRQTGAAAWQRLQESSGSSTRDRQHDWVIANMTEVGSSLTHSEDGGGRFTARACSPARKGVESTRLSPIPEH